MKTLELSPTDVTFQYKGIACTMTNFQQNHFTGVWTFDLGYGDQIIYGVPITAGTSVVAGNGTIFNKIVFADFSQTKGVIKSLPNTKMFILEE